MTKSPEQNRILWVLLSSIFVAMLGVGVIAPVMPLYASRYGAAGFSLGLIYAMFSVSRMIFMPVAGNLSDKSDRKRFIASGLAIYAISSLGYIWADSVIELIWVRFLHGFGSAMVIPIAAALIGDLSPKGSEGRMMGSFQATLFAGFGFGPLLGGAVHQWAGPEWVFCLMGGFTFISLLSVLIMLPRPGGAAQQKKPVQKNFRETVRNRRFAGLLVFRFSNAVGRAALIAFLPVLADGFGISAAEIGFLISLNILLTGALQYLFGKMADRFSRVLLILIGGLINAVALLLLPIGDSLFAFIFISLMIGIGAGAAFPAAGAIATELGRSYGMGNIMGFFNMGMSLGMVVGPIVSGWILNLFGMPYVFVFAGIIEVAGTSTSAVLLSRKSRQKSVKKHG